MAKNLIIRDYQGRAVETDFDIGNLEDVLRAKITITTGDEILMVIFKDGELAEWDSCPGGRILNFEDAEYDVYYQKHNINLLSDEKWLSMTDSYDRLMYALSREEE